MFSTFNFVDGTESLKIFFFQFSQRITLLTAKLFHFSWRDFRYYENVNMTQLEIQHSEKSERK